jgi:Glycine/sarcosine/betaine reductase selenoprotein B (GRDB)
VLVDSFKFLPRTFRPLYEGRGPFPGEEEPVWVPFEKRLTQSRIALLTSAGLFVKGSQAPFDLEREQAHPEWGDPTWRAIPVAAGAGDIGVAHLHLNDEDLLADPEIALPMHLLGELAAEGVIGGSVSEHLSVMGFQDRSLRDWKDRTAPEIVAHLRDQLADGLILAPA